MNTSSETSLLLRIHALERALSKCKRHRMVNAYYTRPQTKPLRPTHHDNDTLQIWITSTSYVNYYQNIAYRLNGLKDLYESERLCRLGFRPPVIHQCAPESFVELEPDHDSDEESDSDDMCYDDSHDEASDEDEKSSVATTHESLRSHPKVSRKCPRKVTITSSTTPTTTPLTTAAEYTWNYQGGHGDNMTEGGVCLPNYESSENNSSASPYHLNVEISQNTEEGGVSDGTLSGGSTPQVFSFAPTSPNTVPDNTGFSSPQF